MLKNIEGYDFNIGTESGNRESLLEDEMLKINASGDFIATLPYSGDVSETTV